MAWSIAQVARMSNVTSRTLRHYDQIGLLTPARVGRNGYRYYEREQLLRLQRILIMRELGLGLDAIAEIVNDGRDQVEALRMHHAWLVAERDRFERLAATVARTIEELEGGDDVAGSHWFEGFDEARQAELQEEARQRWGAEIVDAANERVKDKSPEWWQQEGAKWLGTLETLVGLIDAGKAPDDPSVLDAIDGHYRWICQFWTPNRASYAGLGNLYVDDERFRANFDRTDPRLAEFMRDAMAAYAAARL
ncbi:MAG TPA: MerR family transcriptional regulator [Actinophytocola sp.]|uniref:MerR family transcriptional regulator n=1 Tax=Actinophytocola sp. TaxID=1872138 RepID=UPI002DDCD3C0|nr:MerR family transcriptional regulator [Actinophytocola sp.]HEV2779199.1 MerR family transcriptional regulator [Actinophytocola sp.]